MFGAAALYYNIVPFALSLLLWTAAPGQDTDGDGFVTPEERAEFFKRADTDGDGKITPEEWAAADAKAKLLKDAPPQLPKLTGSALIDKAIERGVAWLKALEPGQIRGEGKGDADELMLYALHHGKVDPADPKFAAYLKAVVDRPPTHTYSVGIAAMALATIDRLGYQWKLQNYAQALADSQCINGQWTYECRTRTVTPMPPGGSPGPLYGTRYPPSVARPDPKFRPTIALKRIPIRQNDRTRASGDNSNSQYAALGLRACTDAGFEIDPRCVGDALRWWQREQNEEGGWGYAGGRQKGTGSMTAGAVGSLVIFDWIQKRPWKDDTQVKRGLVWLVDNWDVTTNPPGARNWHLYFLYGLERAGMLYQTDFVGSHDWYKETSAVLLASQKQDGSWGDAIDTCFAILILRRATAPLEDITTPGGRRPPPLEK